MAVIVLKNGDKIQKQNASGVVVDEYVLTSDFKSNGGGRSESATAVNKEGHPFFVKKLMGYAFASDPEMLKKPATRKQHDKAEAYVKQQAEIYSALSGYAQGGTLVIRDYAEVIGCFCYNVFPFINNQNVKVHDLPMADRIRIAKQTAQGVQTLHKANVVHADLKPQNVLLIKNTLGQYTPKIIDFDDSFFEGKTPLPADLISTEEYYSPELAVYFLIEDEKIRKKYGITANSITRKTDVFTLGLIFCDFFTGKLPNPCEPGDYPYGAIFKAVPKNKGLNDMKRKQVLTLPERDIKGNPIPGRIRDLINRMLLPWYEDRPSMMEISVILSMATAEPSPEGRAGATSKRGWKCKSCGNVNGMNNFRCRCGEPRGLNPDIVNI